MIKIFPLLLFFICSIQLQAQNYIPNYSFEDTATRVTPLFLPEYWTAGNREAWDYFSPLHNQNAQYLQYSAPSNLVGIQNAKSGNSYAGILIYPLYDSIYRSTRREYLQVQLNQPLQFDSTYCFQMYMSLADSFRFASKNMLGVYFSSNAVFINRLTRLPYTPQLVVSPNAYITEKQNWVKIDMQYKAVGGEQYITIGNFNDTTYIDTISVPNGVGNQFFFLGSYYYIDDVWLSHCDSIPDSLVSLQEHNLNLGLSVYPNPILQNEFTVQSKKNAVLNFVLYSSLGQQIPIEAIPNRDGYTIKPQTDFKSGLYWLRASDGKREEMVKLIRR